MGLIDGFDDLGGVLEWEVERSVCVCVGGGIRGMSIDWLYVWAVCLCVCLKGAETNPVRMASCLKDGIMPL